MTIARASDLALPEYAAFNHGQELPWMRRWELPFALFQARLSNTAAVLDCTINPVSFAERLSCLYPHAIYRHWDPVQHGAFVLPVGVPDGAFDCVICLNTLEHLVRSQREALIGEMARKLRPEGCLILTSDFYFDASWDDPAFLRIGVMRADREEVFGGWNKLTAREWIQLCAEHDLKPLDASLEDPCEEDQGLYLNLPPHAHACIGGVFGRADTGNPAGKRVVLALLTWNTRPVSLESFHAHLKEAALLRRLGQVPFLCVVDNGSADGTADVLRALDPEVDLPHKFILNCRNVGSSTARNQIIEYALECDADYLLFVDGDIEIVPFSAFAMLRYMENTGHRLGCIGANHQSHTTQRERVSPYMYSIPEPAVTTFPHFAFTQYGMFRCAMFHAGIRFDDSPPFDGPGWGLEDDDLVRQMHQRGFLNRCFSGITYLHRAEHSSIDLLRKRGLDVGALYRQRREYFLAKWDAASVTCERGERL